jgi:uncharacterized protein (DUF2147 family)
MRVLVAFLLLVPLVGPARAEGVSPVGLWRTIDDATGKPRGLVRIYEQDGKLFGRIEGTLIPDDPPDQVCDQCTDERKGMKKLGLVILRNLRRDGDAWDRGDILDPDNGKVYRCRVRVVDDNRSLEVRGYIGVPVFGRTQMWQRAD